MRKSVFLLLILMLPGCGGEVVIDGSSPKAFMLSVDRMQDSLPPDQEQQFALSVSQVIFKHNLEKLKQDGFVEKLATQPPKMTREEFLTREVLAELDGMTAGEVIEHAKTLNFVPE